MCLIIASPTGLVPSEDYLKNANDNNPHGWGVAWSDGSRLYTRKSFDIKLLLDEYAKTIAGYPYIMHFRWATHGGINKKNIHPFEVSPDLRMAHNGILKISEWNKERSDTWHFVQMIRPLIKGEPDCLQDPEYLTALGSYIGSGNKLAFIDNRGRIPIVNRAEGYTEEGIWYSNQHSLWPDLTFDYSWGYYGRSGSYKSTTHSTRKKYRHYKCVSDMPDDTYNGESKRGSTQEQEDWWARELDTECAFCGAFDNKKYMQMIDKDLYLCHHCYSCDSTVEYVREERCATNKLSIISAH